MKAFLAAALFALLPAMAQAQTLTIIGPNTQLLWDVPGFSAVQAQTLCTYNIAQGTGPYVPTVGAVACTLTAPAINPTCAVNLQAQNLIIGSSSITMTTTCSGVTSLPSTPFAYVDVVVPIPLNVKFR